MRVAVCEAGPIDALGDAGSRSVLDLVEATRALGHDVLVVDESEAGALEALAGWRPDVVVVSRPGLFARVCSALQALGVPLVYFAHDIHEIRMAETGRLGEGGGEDDGSLAAGNSSGLNAQRARAMRLVEDFCFTHADLTLLPTEEEVREVQRRHPSANVERLTWFAIETVPHAALADTVRRAVFIGGERHEPNRDGVQWLLADIWPQVSSAFDELVIIGDWSAATIAELRGAAGNVRFTGRLSAAEVDDLMRTALVGLSPLRFGAGQKRKTLDYLAHGLPTVSTSFGVQGHSNIAGEFAGVRVADRASEWVTALRDIADPANTEDWLRLSAAGTAFVESEYGPARHRLALQAVYSRWEG
jgi:glycosyltransferase involved in cell wall biosynthesis